MIAKIIVLYIVLARFTLTNSRVFYTDDSNLGKNEGISYDNIQENFEQSSRDLDLSFSTGDTSSDNHYPRDNSPLFKRVNPVRPYEIPERQYMEINKDVDRPRSYYKLIEVPDRRPKFDEIIVEPKRNPKVTQTTRDRKGEVILELRVLTNAYAI